MNERNKTLLVGDKNWHVFNVCFERGRRKMKPHNFFVWREMVWIWRFLSFSKLYHKCICIIYRTIFRILQLEFNYIFYWLKMWLLIVTNWKLIQGNKITKSLINANCCLFKFHIFSFFFIFKRISRDGFSSFD